MASDNFLQWSHQERSSTNALRHWALILSQMLQLPTLWATSDGHITYSLFGQSRKSLSPWPDGSLSRRSHLVYHSRRLYRIVHDDDWDKVRMFDIETEKKKNRS